MCGIGGVLYPVGRPADATELRDMAALLHSRGPDGHGVRLLGPAGLAHTRLSILDTSHAGDQPMSGGDGRYTITFNGEIYNFLELRRELEALGWSFCSETDTEVLLKAYMQWGADCQDRLNGMWAFAIWDAQERTLFLSRDRFGVKPLHYAWDGRNFAFGSVMKAFLPLGWIDWEVDADALAVVLVHGSRLEGTETCLFKGLRRLPAGHCLTVRPGEPPRLRRWWNTLDALPTVPAGFAEQAELVREVFLDACRLRLRSDVPVATALSGGIDSSAVHGAIAHLGRQDGMVRGAADWQRAYVADYAGSRQSERPYAEAVIRHAGTRGVFEMIDVDAVAANADRIIFDVEEVVDNVAAPWLLYRRMRRDGVLVSLDGHGGDELFIGYHHQLQSALRETAEVGRRATYQAVLDGFTPDGYAAFASYDPPRSRADLLGRPMPVPPPLPGRDADLERFNRYDPLTRCAYADLHFTTLPTILRNFDRCSMAHGVEVRAPFMDWRLVTLAFALPADAKIANGYSKYILREALSDLLPDMVRTRRQKLGFVTPVADWMRSALTRYMLDVAGSRSFLETPHFDGPAVCMAIEQEFARGRGEAIWYFWPFIHAARLFDQFRSWRSALPAPAPFLPFETSVP